MFTYNRAKKVHLVFQEEEVLQEHLDQKDLLDLKVIQGQLDYRVHQENLEDVSIVLAALVQE